MSGVWGLTFGLKFKVLGLRVDFWLRLQSFEKNYLDPKSR